MRFYNINTGEHPEFIIVGLGRNEAPFRDSRASIPYDFIDYLDSVSTHGNGCKKFEHSAYCDKCMIDGVIFYLAKPNLFINNVGMSVRDILEYYSMHPSKLVVFYDDITCKPGECNVSYGEEELSHEGLLSVERYIKSNKFIRVGIGIGAPENEEEKRVYRLSPMEKEDRKKIKMRYESFKKFLILLTKYKTPDVIRVYMEDELEKRNRTVMQYDIDT